MTEFIVATEEELRLLSKTERWIYEQFRLRGMTKQEICAERKISKETFRGHWSRAMSKIRKHRQLTENPQYFLMRGKDVLRSSSELHGLRQSPMMGLRNVARPPDTDPGRNPLDPEDRPFGSTVRSPAVDTPPSGS